MDSLANFLVHFRNSPNKVFREIKIGKLKNSGITKSTFSY